MLNSFRHTQHIPAADNNSGKKKSLATFTEEEVSVLHPAHQLLWSAFHVKEDDTEDSVQERQALLFAYLNNTLLADFRQVAAEMIAEGSSDNPPIIPPMPEYYDHSLRITPDQHYEFVTTGTVEGAAIFSPKKYKVRTLDSFPHTLRPVSLTPSPPNKPKVLGSDVTEESSSKEGEKGKEGGKEIDYGAVKEKKATGKGSL